MKKLNLDSFRCPICDLIYKRRGGGKFIRSKGFEIMFCKKVACGKAARKRK